MTDTAAADAAKEKVFQGLGEVVPGLWIGGIDGFRDLSLLCRNRTKKRWYIITVLSSDSLIRLSKSFLETLRIECAQEQLSGLSISHKLWNLPDDVRANFLSDDLIDVLKFMDEGIPASEDSSNACFVHCAQGVSRSAAVCTAWLVSRQQKTLHQALDMVRYVRPQASPNLGFLASLRALEQCQGDVKQARLRFLRK
jgi:protein-tyrosine phosphatase